MEVSSPQPLLYLKNLPHVEDVPKIIANNTIILVDKGATRRIANLRNPCAGCLRPEYLTTPRRLEFIPEGTKFKVVDEYMSYRMTALGSSQIPMLILKDENGNISETSIILFEVELSNPQGRKLSLGREESKTFKMLRKFESGGRVTINYCPKVIRGTSINVNKFFDDFDLENDVKIHKTKPLCKNGTTITFINPESFLTARFYFEAWSLYGNWYLSSS